MAGMVGRRNGAVIKVSQIWGIIIYPLILIVLFYGWIYGGLGTLKTAAIAFAQTHLSSGYSSPYAIHFCSGPWFKYLLDFLLLTPIVTLFFVGYAGYLCIQRKVWDFNKMYFLLYFIYVYAVLSCLPHSKVVRYVVNLEMVMALFAVLMLEEVLKSLEAPKRQFFMFFFAFGIFMLNWFSFVDLFYYSSLLDPITFYLMGLRHFIPESINISQFY